MMFMPGRLYQPKQLDELLHSQAGVGDNATEGTGPDLLVIGHDDSRVRLVATKHHVTAGLPTKNEADALQGSADFSAR
jgi:hypothetical protein